uniref:Uncharacterized protein n=1 Tax=Poecilia mexicana TaxID=48701 RepID=A0A3B3WPV1_9TELE
MTHFDRFEDNTCSIDSTLPSILTASGVLPPRIDSDISRLTGTDVHSVIANCCQNIAAGSLEVVGLAIKGQVVRVSRGRAGAMWVGMAAKLTPYNMAGLLRSTCIWGTLDYTITDQSAIGCTEIIMLVSIVVSTKST